MSPLPLFDTHCHLQDPRLGPDLSAVLDRARAAGVAGFACCGTEEADWGHVRAIAKAHPDVVPLLGLHPWYVHRTAPGWLERLEGLAVAHGAGIGEIGLDGVIEAPGLPAQEEAFRLQLRLARRLGRPVSIHCRRAWERLLAVLREEGVPEGGAVVHAYSGSAETARELQSLGIFLAFGCSLANPANRRAAKALLAVAPDRLLFETDSPDIPPRHLPEWSGDRPNEPANMVLVLEAAARLRGEDEEALACRVQGNALRVFPPRP